MKIEYICLSHKGRRAYQEDNFLCNGITSPATQEPVELVGTCRIRDGAPGIFCVFDGLGGEPDGELASRFAAQAAQQQITQPGPLDFFLNTYRTAHKAITENQSPFHQIKTTAAAVWISDSAVYASNIGDSRVYCHGPAGLTQVSRDDRCCLTNSRHYLTQCLGSEKPFSSLEPHVSVCASPAEVEQILLCTDGLFENITELDLCEALRLSASVEETGRRLLQQALSGSVDDNITFILLRLLPNE